MLIKNASTYDKWAKPQIHTAQHLGRLVKDPQNKRTLDAGCGTGAVSRVLMERFPHINLYGLDQSQEMLEHYVSLNNNIIHANLENLSELPKDTFDYIVSSFALHWTSLYLSFAELYRVLKGKLYVAVPVFGSLWKLFGKRTAFGFPDAGELLCVVRDVGLKVLYVKSLEIKIPYRGKDLIRHFRYTSTRVPDLYPRSYSCLREFLQEFSEKVYRYMVLFLVCGK